MELEFGSGVLEVNIAERSSIQLTKASADVKSDHV